MYIQFITTTSSTAKITVHLCLVTGSNLNVSEFFDISQS